VTDEQLDRLMTQAATGDRDAQEMVDDWISGALAALRNPLPAQDATSWLDVPDCCCRKPFGR